MEPVVSEFLRPTSEPDKYVPDSDVVAWEMLDSVHIVLEVFKRKNGTFGFRYNAWVAWRDAGDEVRSHSWYRRDPESNLITDNFLEACSCAVRHANEHGLSSTGKWNHVA